MKYKIVFLERAIAEMHESYNWYEEQQVGLGNKFIAEIEKCKDSIASKPEQYKITYKKFREVLVKTFPFLMVYQINKSTSEIIIISIFHCKRNPKKKYIHGSK